MGRELGLLIRDLTGVLLLIAAITKAADRHNSTAALAMALGLRRARRVLPPLLAVEVAIGIALLLGLIPPASLALAAVLFAAFAVYLARTRGASVGCGCFGLGIPSRATRFTIARNLGGALAAAAVAILAPPSGPSGGVADGSIWILLVGCAGAVSLTAATALDAVRETRRLARGTSVSDTKAMV